MFNVDKYDIRDKVYLDINNSVAFVIDGRKYHSELSKKSGELDCVKTRMIAELHKQQEFSLIFKERLYGY